jgi:hypothetical protein
MRQGQVQVVVVEEEEGEEEEGKGGQAREENAACPSGFRYPTLSRL